MPADLIQWPASAESSALTPGFAEGELQEWERQMLSALEHFQTPDSACIFLPPTSPRASAQPDLPADWRLSAAESHRLSDAILFAPFQLDARRITISRSGKWAHVPFRQYSLTSSMSRRTLIFYLTTVAVLVTIAGFCLTQAATLRPPGPLTLSQHDAQIGFVGMLALTLEVALGFVADKGWLHSGHK